jgi:hypothetical protein
VESLTPKPIASLIDKLAPAANGAPRIERREIAPGATVSRRAPTAGDIDLSGMRISDAPQGDWRRTAFDAAPVACFIIRDALVYSAAGLIAIDEFVLAETLGHANPETCGFTKTGDGGIVLHPRTEKRTTERQVHLLAGAADNYYHWILDVLTRAVVCERLAETRGAARLMPPLRVGFQGESIDLLAAPDRPVGHLANHEALTVAELIFVPSMTGAGWRPHPLVLQSFRQMRRSASPAARRPTRRLYLDRRGARNRLLTNEAEVIQALEKLGFEALRLESMSLRDQIAAFAEASIVVAPHGAGLANILFSFPGVAIVELLMDSYVNWCFRNMAALNRARYSCVIGTTDGEWNPDWPHGQSWTVSVPRTVAAVDAALAGGRR